MLFAGNVYCLRNQNMQGYSSNTIVIDSAQGISFSLSEKNKNISYLVQLSANLDVNWKITLDDSMTFNSNTPSMTLFHDIAFDTDSNLLFLSATSHRGYVMDTINFCSVLKYLDYPLSLKNDAFVISFSLDGALPSLHSYGRVPSIYNSEAATNARGNLVCLNNRVFMQSAYMGGVHFPSQDIHFNQAMPTVATPMAALTAHPLPPALAVMPPLLLPHPISRCWRMTMLSCPSNKLNFFY